LREAGVGRHGAQTVLHIPRLVVRHAVFHALRGATDKDLRGFGKPRRSHETRRVMGNPLSPRLTPAVIELGPAIPEIFGTLVI
jgi:hypothetical protein